MKAEHVFPVARLCKVEAEWLATGAGKRTRDAARIAEDHSAYADVPRHRIALIRLYGTLPDDIRRPIRAMIETLSSGASRRLRSVVERAAATCGVA